MINSVFRTGNNYYSQVFLQEYNYVVKEKKMPMYIIGNIEISSDSDEGNSDRENYDEENPDKASKIYSYKNTNKIFFYNFFSIYKSCK